MLDLRDEMRRAGVECDARVITDGKIHRFKVPGSHKANGWYVFDRDGDKIFGAFGDWKAGITATFGKQTAAIKEVRQQRNIDADVRALKAAKRSEAEWDLAYAIVRQQEHAYLASKRVAPFGLRCNYDRLLVPMRRGDAIVGLQKIYPDGQKLFTPGCRKLGSSHLIGAAKSGMIAVLCEGYATGASIHMATRLPVLVTFDCGNLLPAAREFDNHHPVAKWIIAADNDHSTVCPKHKAEGVTTPIDPDDRKRPAWCRCNPGKTAGIVISKELGGKLALPITSKTDFNDMHLEHGLDTVADAVYACL